MKRILLISALVLFVTSFVCADIYIKSMKRTGAYEMTGRKIPETVRIEEQWLAKNKFAVISKEFNMVVDFEKEKLYFIGHRAKQVIELSTDIDKAKLRDHLSYFSGTNATKIMEVINSIKISDMKVRTNSGTKKIANWNCSGSELEMVVMIPALNIMPKIHLIFWTTKDVPFNYQNYSSGINELFQRMTSRIITIDDHQKKEMEKLNKVDGFQVAGEVTLSLLGAEIRQEEQCLEVVEKPAPPEVYSVPKGYKKTIPLFPKKQDLEKQDI